ncbi:MAG: DUF4412 domain-containing protein [Acidobacteriota bacterium]|nr:DUF4412 domain-containing protein [Acidobacteriota bacterium]
MKSRISTVLVVTATILLLQQLATAQMPMQPVPFSADMQFSSTHAASDNMPREIKGKLYFGSGHMRMDIQGGPRGGSIVITDFKTQTTDIIMPEQRMYMEHKASAMPGRGGPGMADIKPLADPNNPCAHQDGMTCKKVGVEQVDERTCDHWQITDKNGKVSNVWVDEKLHFPIKTVSEDSTWELTGIIEGEPSASLFVVPLNYHKMDLGGVMNTGRPPEQ